MDDGTRKSPLRDTLQWCSTIQKGRVRQLLLHESAQQKLQPNGWREIALLVNIAEKIEKFAIDTERANSQIQDRIVPPEEQPGFDDASEEIQQLTAMERDRIRRAGEKFLRILKRQSEAGDVTPTVEADGGGEDETRK